ncbi:MAG: phosphoribosylglycinamide formyltransferase [Oscillospiraceae bacterium]|jgi:phosphoribosylglycinamide formyltransferase-1|nr:phosphoribosylglycinamide formyltransferase [Oscillospiraceae bacterium]
MAVKTAVFVSGGGTNLQALIDRKLSGGLDSCELTLVVSSNPDAYALERAKAAGIETAALDRQSYADSAAFCKALEDLVAARGIELIVLAGFMTVLTAEFIAKHENRTINVHPSLIPSFCGKGFYGLRVHKAALDYGVKVTGATVFIVTPEVDAGPIIAQKAVAVQDGDTPETLQRRVMAEAEHVILPEAVEEMCRRISGR